MAWLDRLWSLAIGERIAIGWFPHKQVLGGPEWLFCTLTQTHWYAGVLRDIARVACGDGP